jgi:hypothetical protein
MRNMLAFLAMVVLTLGVVGWYLDWYRFHSTPADAGHKSVTVDINTKKISEDLLKAEQKIQQRLAEKAKEGGESGESKKALDIPSPGPDVNND